MSKAKLYKIDNRRGSNNNSAILNLIVELFVYAIVLFVASNIFKNFEITNILYCFIAAIILSVLNETIKPLLVFLTFPLTVITLGLAYPIVNMIILKLCDLLMGSSFSIHGFFSLFFISIFISFLKLIMDKVLLGKGGN
jgi:putative membrane protein